MTALSDYFTSLATKIRSKTEKSATLTPTQMIPEIDEVSKSGTDYAKDHAPALPSAKCRPITFSNSTWETKDFYVSPPSFDGASIWTDGDNIYFSYRSGQYVLNKSTSTWEPKTWSGLTSFQAINIWTDGDNIYYSASSNQYVLNKSTSTWEPKSWSGLTSFLGRYIWTDGDNIYYSQGTTHYVLNKSTSTWQTKTWSGLTRFSSDNVWTDGDNIYYSGGSNQYVLPRKRMFK